MRLFGNICYISLYSVGDPPTPGICQRIGYEWVVGVTLSAVRYFSASTTHTASLSLEALSIAKATNPIKFSNTQLANGGIIDVRIILIG